jgi:hypothetical protein
MQMAWSNFKTPVDKHFKGVTTYFSSNGDVHPAVDIKVNYDYSDPQNEPDIGDTTAGAIWDLAMWQEDPNNAGDTYWATGDRALSVWNGVKPIGHVGAVRTVATLTNATFAVNGWTIEYEKGEK